MKKSIGLNMLLQLNVMVLMHLLIISIPNLTFPMYVNVGFTPNKVAIPSDIIAKIVCQPDREKIYEIIHIQEKINILQNFHGRKIKPKQKFFGEIQKALFPCFALTQTCWSYYNCKEVIARSARAILSTIFRQGIALFLLPKPIQMSVHDNHCSKDQKVVDDIINLCTIEKDRMGNFSPSHNFFVALENTKMNLLKLGYTITHDQLFHESEHILSLTFTECDVVITPNNNNSWQRISWELTQRIFIYEWLTLNITLPNPNDIIYEKGYKLSSYKFVECVLYTLSEKIGGMARTSDLFRNLSIQDIVKHFKNWFIVFDSLCSLDAIDLRVSSVRSERTLAQEIKHQFEAYPYPMNFFSEKSLAKINETFAYDNLESERNPEKEYIMDALVKTYLLIIGSSDKEALNNNMTKEKKRRAEKERCFEINLKNVLSRLVETFTTIAQKQRIAFCNKLIKIGVVGIFGFIVTIGIIKKFSPFRFFATSTPLI